MPTIKRFTREENKRVIPVLVEEARVRARIVGETFEDQLDAIVDFYNHEGGARMTPIEVILDSKEDRDDLLRNEAEELAYGFNEIRE